MQYLYPRWLVGLGLSLLLVVPAVVPAAASHPIQKRSKKEIRLLESSEKVIWRDPGRVGALDFEYGPGGRENAPQPPFTFLEEDDDGSNAKIKVRDAKGVEWSVKWDEGGESHAEVIASRIVWACGYFVEPNYFVANGRIEGITDLDRADEFVADDGSFSNARFELKYEAIDKLKDEETWGWERNPFVGTRELDGLKIVAIFVSNWDNKDLTNASRGANTQIHIVEGPNGPEARYLVNDWGGTMGKWGGYFGREKWDCEGFADQTPELVEWKDGGLDWDFKGWNTTDFKRTIDVEDIRWVLKYLGRITDEQFRTGLRASGASPQQIECYVSALRQRVQILQDIAKGGPQPAE